MFREFLLPIAYSSNQQEVAASVRVTFTTCLGGENIAPPIKCLCSEFDWHNSTTSLNLCNLGRSLHATRAVQKGGR